MDQLRQYGLPAFANGGVVQRFAEAGEVTKLKAGEIEVISEEIVTKENGDIVRVRKIRQIGPRGLPIERTVEEVIEPATLTQDTSKNPRNFGQNKKEKNVGGQSNLRLASEMEEGAENLAKSARTSEEIVADVEKKKEELDNSGLNNTDSERDRLTGLEEMVKERSELYKKILGDPKEGLKQQGLLQLAQFGLNLASARGGNFAEKIANSAKDPLQAFAALGRESLKDERAIDMLAIKGAEDEMARTQKVGNFGQLVQDLMNTQGLDRKEASAKAIEIYQQKSGKTIAEMKDERYSELLVLFEKELGEVDKAIEAANAQIIKEFGTGMFLNQENPEEEPEVSRA
jgi:hypothetical protein